MANLNWTYEDQYRGIVLVAQNNDAQLRTVGTGSGSVYDCKKGEWVTLTGYYCWYDNNTDYLYFQTTYGDWFAVITQGAWTRAKDDKSVPHYSRNDVQKYIDAMLANDQHIVENNLFCARYADKLTAEEKKAVVTLQRRVMERQDALKSQGYVTDVQYAKPEGYEEFEPYLDKLMNSGIGFAWCAFIVWCLVLGATAGACYFIYRDFFEQAKEDVKWSDELTKTLMAKLTPEEYEQLRNETAGIVTKSNLRAKLGSWGTMFKVAAMLLAGAFAYKFFFTRE